MSNVNQYIPPSSPYEQTASFGAHRNRDLPASAIQSGASTLPAAWQTRGVAMSGNLPRHTSEPRNLAEVAMAPLRWCFTGSVRAAFTAGVIAACVLMVLF
ncbi:hypothetical protein [Pseudooctadecabacter jejudonensis]|uniref:Uncharacterized protein n=1 Tax=Pseudooctadecabacter jejudonensis TaxID=1391910 RepID=A0A1Y5TFS7_9RHOB|nr:hypothetical protein [Pseudooctadecabacter jejudonensis]SLN59394.1 hypothetical protein PSJ8397_03155 [Pseudooctadecabacter jejudonensis]